MCSSAQLRFVHVLIPVLLATSGALSGCASTTLKSPIPEHAAIAVLTPGVTKQFIVFSGFDLKTLLPGYGFGKVIEGEVSESYIADQLAMQGFDMGSELQKALVDQLAAEGYAARYERVEREGSISPDAVNRTTLENDGMTWAFLDARVTDYGFAGQVTGEIRPYVKVKVEIIESSSKSILYSRDFTYNLTGVGTNARKVAFEPADQWESFSDMRRNIPRLRDALVNGATRIASALVSDLKGT